MPTIYQQLGAGPGLRKAVDAFYDHVQADTLLAHYFEGIDMERLRWHTATLLSTITGGPAKYDGRDLAVAHAHLNITSEDFMRVAGHLAAVLEAAGASSASVDAVIGALAAHKDEIATADSDSGGPRSEYGR
jgi:hemoglobin